MKLDALIIARLYRNKTMRSFIMRHQRNSEFWVAYIDEYSNKHREINPSLVDRFLRGREGSVHSPITFVGKDHQAYKQDFWRQWHAVQPEELGSASWRQLEPEKFRFNHEWLGERYPSDGILGFVLSLPSGAAPLNQKLSINRKPLSQSEVNFSFDSLNESFVLSAMFGPEERKKYLVPNADIRIGVECSLNPKCFNDAKKRLELWKFSDSVIPENFKVHVSKEDRRHLENFLNPSLDFTFSGIGNNVQIINSKISLSQIGSQYVHHHHGSLDLDSPAEEEKSIENSSPKVAAQEYHEEEYEDLANNAVGISETNSIVNLRYPTDGECAFMAKLVYQNAKAQRAENTWVGQEKADILHAHCHHWREAGWEPLEGELGFYEDEQTDYVGSAYVNHRLRQVVIAHRGTQLTRLGSLIDDYQSILNIELSSQWKSAAVYYRRIIGNFRSHGRQIGGTFNDYQLSFTGHSLGAWLSEMCAADALLQFGLKVHTVTFDSPGSRPAIEKHVAHARIELHFNLLQELDIISYLAAPNLINVCNPHVGTLIQVQTTPFACSSISEWFLYTLRMHSMTELLEAFDINSGLPSNRPILQARDWPHYNFSNHRSTEYQKFHAYLHSSDTSSYEAVFRRQYEAHHHPIPLNSCEYPLRHVHCLVRDFLSAYQDVRVTLSQKIENEILKEYLARYTIISEPSTGEKILSLSSNTKQGMISAREFIQNLMAYLAKHETLFYELAQAKNLDGRLIAVEKKQAEEDYPAIMTLIGRNARLKGGEFSNNNHTFARIDERTSTKQLAFLKEQLSQYPRSMLRMQLVGDGAHLQNVVIKNNSQTFFNIGSNTNLSNTEAFSQRKNSDIKKPSGD